MCNKRCFITLKLTIHCRHFGFWLVFVCSFSFRRISDLYAEFSMEGKSHHSFLELTRPFHHFKHTCIDLNHPKASALVYTEIQVFGFGVNTVWAPKWSKTFHVSLYYSAKRKVLFEWAYVIQIEKLQTRRIRTTKIVLFKCFRKESFNTALRFTPAYSIDQKPIIIWCVNVHRALQ